MLQAQQLFHIAHSTTETQNDNKRKNLFIKIGAAPFELLVHSHLSFAGRCSIATNVERVNKKILNCEKCKSIEIYISKRIHCYKLFHNGFFSAHASSDHLHTCVQCKINNTQHSDTTSVYIRRSGYARQVWNQCIQCHKYLKIWSRRQHILPPYRRYATCGLFHAYFKPLEIIFCILIRFGLTCV